ncbi:MAG: glycoside hydrolase family 38 C-terminal domain-containing protein, partial [Candidatus Heimdallarchaeaceae archaeon]
PHDSICGCSIDQTHEEMKSRFYWSESIANIILENILAKMSLDESEKPKEIMIFNPTNSSEPTYFEFDFPLDFPIKTIISEDGQRYTIQPLYSSQEKILDEKMKPLMLKSGLKLLPGRKIIDDYINEVIINKDEENSICEIKIICGKKPIGELNIDKMKKELKEMINSGKFKLFHVVATRGVKQKYASFAPLKPWSFTRFTVNSSIKANDNTITQKEFNVTKNTISNNYYIVKFKRNGSFSLYDKKTKTEYSLLHQFEDTGDRGDEYTYSFVGPVKTKLSKTKRRIITKGEVFTVVEEKATFKTFRQLDEKREKRIGKTKIDVVTHFTFFRDSPRIDIKTKIFNTAKDHRLRITFSLPFSSKKTYTSTHFGYIERNSYPKEAENYVEKPSGIQAQKRWIRVENEKGEEAFTLINKGLPEVELVEGSKLCLTLLRSVGWLSRSDFPERPMHAGPFLYTPGAQEENKSFEFEYSIVAHSKNKNIVYSDNLSERISSLRKKDGAILVTLYNLSEKKQETTIQVPATVSKVNQIMIDGTVVKELEKVENKLKVGFDPIEIKMLKLD